MFKGNGYAFVQATKYANLSKSDNELEKPQPPLEIPLEEGKPLIDLPRPEDIDLGSYDLRKAIEERRSLRRYTDDPLTLEELSYLLWLTQGVKSIDEKRKVTWRTVPSAGARHPFETYLSVNNVGGLERGLYRFVASQHKLVSLRPDETFNERLTDASLGQRSIATSAVTFIWVAIPERTIWRYAERSFRYLYLDAGHVCQNLSLAAESIHCGVCAIGAYNDDAVDELLGLTPPEKFAIYMAPVGRRGEPKK